MCTFSLRVNVKCRDWVLVAVDFLPFCFVLAELVGNSTVGPLRNPS